MTEEIKETTETKSSGDAMVYLHCVREGSKLRVRILSSGYNREANCQFPRAIRSPGRQYAVPKTAISFARGSGGKFFYRVSKNQITVLSRPVDDSAFQQSAKVEKIFEDEDPTCAICLYEERNVVVVPCGHYCMCKECATQIAQSTGTCPLCRGPVALVVTRDQIQT